MYIRRLSSRMASDSSRFGSRYFSAYASLRPMWLIRTPPSPS
jgi:hypothetical protein